MNRFFPFLSGVVRVQISGEDLPRFLNLCRARNLYFKNLCFYASCRIEGEISAREFYKLISIRRKAQVHIHIVQKQGLPFFLHRMRRKKSFLLGIFLGFFILLFLSSRVWTVSIDGNMRNSSVELLLFLNKNGISPGIPRKTINCSQISELLRQNYTDITWVSTRLQGTALAISVREGFQKEEKDLPAPACDFVATEDGKIVSMVTKRGVPLKKQGDICKQGEILVLGEVEIKNDAQEVVRVEEVAADAEIYLAHEIPYYHEIPLHSKQLVPKKQKEERFSIQFGDWYLESFLFSWPPSNPFKKQKDDVSQMTTQHSLAYKSVFFPFSIGKTEKISYQTEAFVHTKTEAFQKAEQTLEEYEKNLIEKGVQISANNVTIKVNDFICKSQGSLTVIEKTGMPKNRK